MQESQRFVNHFSTGSIAGRLLFKFSYGNNKTYQIYIKKFGQNQNIW